MQATGNYRAGVFIFSEGKLSLLLLSENIYRQSKSTFFIKLKSGDEQENYSRL
jgi:hypothetical protein